MKGRSVMQSTAFQCILTLLILVGTRAYGESNPAAITVGVMHLAHGDFVTGELKDCDQSDRLRWQSPAFTTPFEFALGSIHSIRFPNREGLPKSMGDFCFELAGGDLLFGSLIGLDTHEAEIDLPPLGKIHLLRDHLRRLSRWRDGDSLIFLGPNGLAGWDESPHQGAWREEAGHIVTDVAGTSIHGRLGIPARAAMELEFSWTKKPNFILALGVDDTASNLEDAFRLEVWGQDLVAVLETDGEADLAALQKIEVGPGRIHLRAYLDIEHNRFLVFSEAGKQLADLYSSEKPGQPLGSGIRLMNQQGDVRLEKIYISRWNGVLPREVQQARSRIDRTDRSALYGEIKEFDSATKQFVLAAEAKQSRIAIDDIETIAFVVPDHSGSRTLRAILQNGARLSGRLTKVDAGRLFLECPGITERVGIPISELSALSFLESDEPIFSDSGRHGRVELEGIRLNGYLVDGLSQDNASCLVWQPRGSFVSSPIQHGVSGRIVYREPVPPPPVRAVRIQQRRQQLGIFGLLFSPPTENSPQMAPLQRSLHLRSGDTIPCEVKQIDERGLYFKTPVSDTTFVSHDRIKAVELAPSNRSIKINKEERARLLTLPRIQKDNPPTHLIRSANGDCLRCRIIAMDDQTCTAEVRLDNKQLRRDCIAWIVWLHDDELDPVKSQDPSDQASPTRVQAVRSNGIRLTLVTEQLAGSILSGTSPVLGACRIGLEEVDQLLIGGAIDQAATELAAHQWKLHHARPPRFVSTDNTDGGHGHHIPGTESALVGHPAPDFQLDLLDGGTFKLSDCKGTVIVLDFWTTWCGPCIQSMPAIDRIVREYEDRGVRFIAVNLQETPELIASTLKRLNLETTVALDQEGIVAEKYGATAIPHTVIIDSDGTIARLYIGGGPQLGDHLRDAFRDIFGK
ncbi:MAG: TlpA family protein disulfide reductase [Pirellulales bacterium]|nr:TlpA family protein disulfide reductase [Pirellulales bacterium]